MVYQAASNIMQKTLKDGVTALIKRPHLALIQVNMASSDASAIWC